MRMPWSRTSAAPRSSPTSAPWSTPTSSGPRTRTQRRCEGQPHGPQPDDGPLRPLGDLAGPRHRHRQQDRDAHRLHHAVRRQRLRLAPIADLYKSQVRQLSVAVGVPDAIVRKAPSRRPVAGPDRRVGGRLQLREIDRILFRLVDRRRSLDELVARRLRPGDRGRVDRLVAGAEFKRQMPPIAKVGPRTAGVDYLYPRRRRARPRAEWGARRRTGRCTWSRRPSATWAT